MKANIERLENGLTVVLRESHTAPVVAFQVWTGVGSADEKPAEAGLAHVLEHMLFKGTARRGVGEIARDVERAGGYINAWTSYDETVYHITLASRFADQGLDVLADAVSNPALDPGELSRELNVIREEIRMGKDNPARVATEQLFGQIYHRHPYGRPVIGYDRTVRGFTRSVVARFHRRWYVPRNAVLVVAGDFDTAAMLRKIAAAFGGWKGGAVPRRVTRVAEPGQRKMRFAHSASQVSEVNLALGYPAPGLTHADVPTLDILAAVVGQGASSRLETEVRRRAGLVTDVRALSYSPRDAGVFGIYAMIPPKHLSRAVRALAEQLNRVTVEPIPPHEVEKARTMLLSDAIYSEETVEGLARKLGFYRLHSGDVGFEDRYLAGLNATGPAELLEVARRYLAPQRTNISVVVPDPTARSIRGRLSWVKGRGKARKVEPTALRKVIEGALEAGWNGSIKTRRAPQVRPETFVRELESGDVVIVKREPTSRLVAARVAYLGGMRHEPVSKGGLSALLAACLTRGSENRSAEEVAAQMDAQACSVAGFAGRNSFGAQGEFLSRGFTEGFALMAECLRRPALAEPEVEREKELQIEEIVASKDRLDQQAFEMFQARLFGRHPYGRSVLGREETVATLTSQALRRQLEATTSSSQMVLAVVGGCGPDQVFELVEQHLAIGKRSGKRPRDPAIWKPPTRPVQVGRSVPKQQSHVVLGFPGTTIDRRERFAVDVLVELLGGHGGRLFAVIRERLGLAYAVTAMSMEGIEPGYVAMYAGTSPGNEARVVDAMLGEARRIRVEPPKRAELERIKRHLMGTRAIARQRNGVRAAGAALGYLYGIGHDADERYPEEIRTVTVDDVTRAAGLFLDPGRMIASCVGPYVEQLELI
ncbi:MAG: insulinase family protein [Deltaproteobacteria bacterium]|nr:insulinase family protein [Deltaproteobacteria bacterium]